MPEGTSGPNTPKVMTDNVLRNASDLELGWDTAGRRSELSTAPAFSLHYVGIIIFLSAT